MFGSKPTRKTARVSYASPETPSPPITPGTGKSGVRFADDSDPADVPVAVEKYPEILRIDDLCGVLMKITEVSTSSPIGILGLTTSTTTQLYIWPPKPTRIFDPFFKLFHAVLPLTDTSTAPSPPSSVLCISNPSHDVRHSLYSSDAHMRKSPTLLP